MNNLQQDIRDLVSKHYTELNGVKKFIPNKTFIPATTKSIDENEVRALVESALKFEITDGEVTKKFELEMARYCKTRYATFCNSGSSANLLAFMSLTSPKLGSRAIRSGDEVITCAVGFPTTVAPIIQAGCIPVYLDVTLGTYNVTPSMVSDAITEKTKAIFLAHTLGNPFDVKAIKEIAIQNNLWLIEDCADALGGMFDGNPVGTYGDISTTSFFPAHMITTGEGGMVFTDNSMLNQIIRSMRDWGRDCWCKPGNDNTCGKRFDWKDKGGLPDGFDHKYVYSHVGYNLKSTDLQAAIGLEQLKKLPLFVTTRQHNWNKLCDDFYKYGLDSYFILPSHYSNSNPSWFGFALTIRDNVGFTRSSIVQYLESSKIGTRNLFGGNLTKQPGFMKIGRIADEMAGSLPKADIVMNKTFWIGVHPKVTDEMIDYMVASVYEFVLEKAI